MKISNHVDFRLQKAENDDLGIEHYRYVQTYKDIPRVFPKKGNASQQMI